MFKKSMTVSKSHWIYQKD